MNDFIICQIRETLSLSPYLFYTSVGIYIFTYKVNDVQVWRRRNSLSHYTNQIRVKNTFKENNVCMPRFLDINCFTNINKIKFHIV